MNYINRYFFIILFLFCTFFVANSQTSIAPKETVIIAVSEFQISHGVVLIIDKKNTRATSDAIANAFVGLLSNLRIRGVTMAGRSNKKPIIDDTYTTYSYDYEENAPYIKNIRANYLLTANLTMLADDTILTAQIIEVDTGIIVSSINTIRNVKDYEELLKFMSKYTKELMYNFIQYREMN